MKIFNNPSVPKNYKGHAIAIGNFDGVHKGHQRVFNEAKKYTKIKKIKLGVLTFSPLPVMFFNKKIINYKLTSEKQKFKLFKKYGVNFVVNIKFNKKFSKITAEKFIKNIIYKKINPKLIFVSNNFKFGNKRRGNINLLKKFSQKYNYKLRKINPFKYEKGIISSTIIRKFLQNGHLNKANKLLSRNWFIDGQVKKGQKLGRKLGYRTCNINIKNYIIPKVGIYAVKVLIGNTRNIYRGVSYLGSRPTFGGKKVFLETNIFGIKKNLYKKRLRVYFVKMIREDKKFKNQYELIKQMNKDVIFAKKGLKAKLVL
jgi:riboflavin kinase/FMN adenylyltransferase